MSRDLRPQAKIEYTVQVQMRFCLIDLSKEQDDCFPNSICVRVNGKMAPLPVYNRFCLRYDSLFILLLLHLTRHGRHFA